MGGVQREAPTCSSSGHRKRPGARILQRLHAGSISSSGVIRVGCWGGRVPDSGRSDAPSEHIRVIADALRFDNADRPNRCRPEPGDGEGPALGFGCPLGPCSSTPSHCRRANRTCADRRRSSGGHFGGSLRHRPEGRAHHERIECGCQVGYSSWSRLVVRGPSSRRDLRLSNAFTPSCSTQSSSVTQ